MKIAKTSNLIDSTKIEDKEASYNYLRSIDSDIESLFLLSQGRVRFGTGSDGDRGENMSGEFQVVADTGTANAEFSITHTLGTVPIGYLITKTNKGGVVYDSGTAWTSTTIYLKCSTANTTITVFLLK